MTKDKCFICGWEGDSELVLDNKCPECNSTDMDDVNADPYETDVETGYPTSIMSEAGITVIYKSLENRIEVAKKRGIVDMGAIESKALLLMLFGNIIKTWH